MPRVDKQPETCHIFLQERGTLVSLGTPTDLNGPEQPHLGLSPMSLHSGPGAPLKLRPGPCHSQPCSLLSQLPDLFFLYGSWRDIAGSLSPALSPASVLDMCPSLVFSPGAGSCRSPLGLCADPSPGSLSQFAESCWQDLSVSPTQVPWDCSSGDSTASAGVARGSLLPPLYGVTPLPLPGISYLELHSLSQVYETVKNAKRTLFHFPQGRGLTKCK